MDWAQARRQLQGALIWVFAAGLAFVLWRIRDALLLAFGGVLAAIALDAIARLIFEWTHLPRRAGVAAAALLVLAAGAGTAWLFGSRILSQLSDLLRKAEAGEQLLEKIFGHGGSIGSTVAEKGSSFIAGMIEQGLSTSLTFIEAAVVLIITAIYLAAQPDLYRRGAAALVGERLRPRALTTLELIGTTLRLWLASQAILMLGVGVLSGIAAYVIGLPHPLALAAIAGFSEMIPYVGPFIGAVPSILVALAVGPAAALWMGSAYLAIHIVEGYVAAPLLQRHFVTIPPALILIGIVAVDLLFGTMGLVLGAPIAIAIYVAVKGLYVQDPLERGATQHH